MEPILFFGGELGVATSLGPKKLSPFVNPFINTLFLRTVTITGATALSELHNEVLRIITSSTFYPEGEDGTFKDTDLTVNGKSTGVSLPLLLSTVNYHLLVVRLLP